MVTLQRELETLVATAKKLDSQRADAKKRLDELDVKVRYLMGLFACILLRCRKWLREVYHCSLWSQLAVDVVEIQAGRWYTRTWRSVRAAAETGLCAVCQFVYIHVSVENYRQSITCDVCENRLLKSCTKWRLLSIWTQVQGVHTNPGKFLKALEFKTCNFQASKVMETGLSPGKPWKSSGKWNVLVLIFYHKSEQHGSGTKQVYRKYVFNFSTLSLLVTRWQQVTFVLSQSAR